MSESKRKKPAWDGGPPMTPEATARYGAMVKLIGRTGAHNYRIEHTDPANGQVAWVAVCAHKTGMWTVVYSAGGGMGPVQATHALCERLIDGGTCVHCGRGTAMEPLDTPLDDDLGGAVDDMTGVHIDPCWYRFDPELRTYRRSCE